MTTSLLTAAFAHHIWATKELIDACAALNPEQLTTPISGTRGSILDTWRHIAEGDSFFLSVVKGAPASLVSTTAPLGEVATVMATNGLAWVDILAGDLDPEADVVELDNGWEFHFPMGVRLAQVIHHGSDHRSQICTTLTGLRLTPPEIDLWAFATATGRARVVEA